MEPLAERLPSVASWQREQDLLPEIESQEATDPEAIPDVTREPLLFPSLRAVRLQSLSRAETGGVLALGYANMRGYGSVHPTINVDNLDPKCELPGLVLNQPRKVGRVDAILNNSFGMLGINSTLIVKRFVA